MDAAMIGLVVVGIVFAMIGIVMGLVNHNYAAVGGWAASLWTWMTAARWHMSAIRWKRAALSAMRISVEMSQLKEQPMDGKVYVMPQPKDDHRLKSVETVNVCCLRSQMYVALACLSTIKDGQQSAHLVAAKVHERILRALYEEPPEGDVAEAARYRPWWRFWQ